MEHTIFLAKQDGVISEQAFQIEIIQTDVIMFSLNSTGIAMATPQDGLSLNDYSFGNSDSRFTFIETTFYPNQQELGIFFFLFGDQTNEETEAFQLFLNPVTNPSFVRPPLPLVFESTQIIIEDSTGI